MAQSLSNANLPCVEPDGDIQASHNHGEHIVITLHGIRTFGRWQERFETLLKEREPNIAVYNYKYGFFSVLAFLVPFLRWITTLRFRSALLKRVSAHPNARVDIIAHSFGTHLVGWGLAHMRRDRCPKIHTIILAGSVLKARFRWEDLMDGGYVYRVVNECATRDYVLLLNQAFVLFTGAAGRLGFDGMLSTRFRNNWYPFGHSGYFESQGKPSDRFMSRRWVPILTSAEIPPHLDARPENWNNGLLMLLLQNAEPIKMTIYATLLFVPAVIYYTLYTKAFARQLAAEAELVMREDPSQVVLSALLGTESMRQIPLFENEVALRRALTLLPEPVATLHHDGEIKSLAFSPDGNYIATAGMDGTARLFETKRRQEVWRITHSYGATVVAFSADGRYLATGSIDKTARVFDIAKRNELWRVNCDGAVSQLVFSRDGRYFVAANIESAPRPRSTLHIFETASKLERWSLKQSGFINAVAFSPDGRYVATGSTDKSARVFAAATGKQIFQVNHPGYVLAVAFSSDGHSLASGGGNLLQVSQVPSGRHVHQFAHQGDIHAVVFSPDGRYVASGSEDNTARIFEVASGTVIGTPLIHGNYVLALAFSPDGHYLATGSADKTARVFEVSSGREVARVGHQDSVNVVAFSPKENLIASGSNDHTVRLFRVNNRGEILRLTGQGRQAGFSSDLKYVTARQENQDGTTQVFGLEAIENPVLRLTDQGALITAYSPDDGYLATGNRDGVVQLFQVTTQNKTFEHAVGSWVTALAVGRDGQYLAVGTYDGMVWVFKGASHGSEIVLWSKKLGGIVQALQFSRNAHYLATGSEDRSVRLFNAETGKLLWQQNSEGVQALAISADESYVAAGRHDVSPVPLKPTVQVFKVANGKQVLDLNQSSSVKAVAFSRDGRYLATGSDSNKTVRIVETESGREVFRLNYQYPVEAVAFSEDNHYLNVALEFEDHFNSVNLILRREPVEPKELISAVCALLPRNFSSEEWNQYLRPDATLRMRLYHAFGGKECDMTNRGFPGRSQAEWTTQITTESTKLIDPTIACTDREHGSPDGLLPSPPLTRFGRLLY